ncbi:hypothetical protein ACSAZL_03485 [Methanosarcina sp. T3]|uniref:hypothetical protein n=1 Tax=Methanosarcina sp. T3 TaxID=3439062 RepID=UPI003F87270C
MGILSCFIKKAEEEIKPKKAGGHGEHWLTALESDDEIPSSVIESIENPEFLEPLNQNSNKINAYFSQGEMLKICTITVNNQLWTAYPFAAAGIAHEIKIDSIEEWINEREAQIRCSLGDASLAFFDIMYFKNKCIYEQGKKYNFLLSALAYSLTKAEPKTLKDREGREFSTKGVAAFSPFEKGDIDDFVFQAPVKEVLESEFGNRTIYRIKTPLFRLNDEDIDIFIFALASATKGYVPSVGDDIEGILWLQGYTR